MENWVGSSGVLILNPLVWFAVIALYHVFVNGKIKKDPVLSLAFAIPSFCILAFFIFVFIDSAQKNY